MCAIYITYIFLSVWKPNDNKSSWILTIIRLACSLTCALSVFQVLRWVRQRHTEPWCGLRLHWQRPHGGGGSLQMFRSASASRGSAVHAEAVRRPVVCHRVERSKCHRVCPESVITASTSEGVSVLLNVIFGFKGPHNKHIWKKKKCIFGTTSHNSSSIPENSTLRISSSLFTAWRKTQSFSLPPKAMLCCAFHAACLKGNVRWSQSPVSVAFLTSPMAYSQNQCAQQT